ncbi:unnamed protein product [Caenorhabditis brenneri]
MSTRLILLLVLCVHLATSAAILTKRRTAGEKKEDLEKMNGYRAQLAKNIAIGNMHELSYDSELEKVAKSMAEDCSFKAADYVLVPSAADFEVFLGLAEDLDVSQVDSDDMKVVAAMFHPLQTKLACFELTFACKNRDIPEGGYCLIGPEKSAPTADTIKHGTPGSHCERGATANGLCKAVSKTGGSYEEAKEGSGAEKPVGNYEKTTPGNVEDKGAETNAATQLNSMILVFVFAIVMIFQ